MHTKLRYLQRPPGAVLPEPQSILDKFPAQTEHPSRAASQRRARFVTDGRASQRQLKPLVPTPRLEPPRPCTALGAQPAPRWAPAPVQAPNRNPPPHAGPTKHLLGSGFGQSRSDARGGKGRLVLHERGREPGRASASRNYSEHN